jgi:2-polyprenyl-3-methyl-5-hydroxy-6-metoxy-1,4-benzoquinol methylase
MDDPRKLLVESGYDALGEAYADWSARVEGDPRDRYLDDVSRRLPAGSRVLDLGCGSGLPSTKLVAERFEVLGVDVSATQIDCARGAGYGGFVSISVETRTEGRRIPRPRAGERRS